MESLEHGIKANAGVSSGSSYTVPSMLFFPEKSFILERLIIKKLINEERLNGIPCYIIQTKHKITNKKCFLWIGKKDFLLRKLKREISIYDIKGLSKETHQNIKTNHEIPHKIFNFKPPENEK